MLRFSCTLYFTSLVNQTTLTLLSSKAADEKDEKSCKESLQFNFNVVRIAIDNFSDTKKLGQGGFGVVYKVISHLVHETFQLLCRNHERLKE